MGVSEPFIRRPIATSLLGIALLIGGALGYFALPVSALPQVDFPTVQVTTQLPGASPDVIASLITAPLERQLGQIPSLTAMNSTSSFGVSQISLQFDLNRDIDGATQDVQAAINAAAGVLPKTLPYPPTYAKVNPADAPVMTLALTLGHDLAARDERHRRHAAGAAAEPDFRRRPRLRARRAEAGGAHPGGSGAARRLWHRHGGSAQRDRQRQRLRAEGLARRRAAILHHRRQRPDRRRRRLQADHHRLPQRLAGHDRRRRPDRRRARERPHRRLVPGHAGRHHRHPAPARRQRHRRRQPDPRRNPEGCSARFRPA